MSAALILGGLNAVGGIASAMQGRKSSKAMSAALAEQAATLRRQREIGDEQYARYKDTFVPIEDQLVDISQTMATPDYAGVLRRATGDYTRARNQTRGEAQRTYNRMGIDPSNPMYLRGINRTSIADALALTTAREMARNAERDRTRDLGFNSRMSVANLGRGNVGNAMSAYGSAGAGFGQQGGIYGQQAAGAYGAAGYFANQAFDNLSKVNWGGRGGAMSSSPMSGMNISQFNSALGYGRPTVMPGFERLDATSEY